MLRRRRYISSALGIRPQTRNHHIEQILGSTYLILWIKVYFRKQTCVRNWSEISSHVGKVTCHDFKKHYMWMTYNPFSLCTSLCNTVNGHSSSNLKLVFLWQWTTPSHSWCVKNWRLVRARRRQLLKHKVSLHVFSDTQGLSIDSTVTPFAVILNAKSKCPFISVFYRYYGGSYGSCHY